MKNIRGVTCIFSVLKASWCIKKIQVTSGILHDIRYGNRTEWSPIRSVIIRVITKSDFFHEYDYRPNWTKVNHKNYNFRGKKNSQVTKEWEICT